MLTQAEATLGRQTEFYKTVGYSMWHYNRDYG